MRRKQIFMTERDHKRLAGLVRAHKQAGKKAGHITALERELERASVVPHHMIPDQVVTMNSRVTYINLDTQQEGECTLVFPGLTDGETKKVSILAPIGAALIGETEGNQLEYEAPGGTMRIQVKTVVHQPEEEEST